MVPCNEIVSGGPGQDGIPPIETPQFYTVNEVGGDLSTSDVILGVEIEGQMYGFPHNILNFHEIVNQRISDVVLAITYCPLTGTGIPYSTGADTVGTSGRLYENNLVYYDMSTNSYWSQMYGLAIKGDLIGSTHVQDWVIETKWSTFSQMYPNSLILSRDTGFSRDYDSYPYAQYDYLNSEAILFESKFNPEQSPYNLYHPKALTLILNFNNEYVLVPYSELDSQIPMKINQNGIDVTVFYDRVGRLVQPFYPYLNDIELQFVRIDQSTFTIDDTFGLWVYEDQLGNVWNMKGEAIFGPNSGEELMKFVNSYTAFWFASMSFFGEGIIYQNDQTIELNEGVNTGEFTDDGLFLSFYQLAFVTTLLFSLS